MARYRMNIKGHYIPVGSLMGEDCFEWVERQVGNQYIFTCKTNPQLEKVYDSSEVVTLR